MNKHMKKFIVCLLLGTLLGIIPSLLPAQQNQNPQQSDTEIEVLKKRVSEIEKQLQTVENVEKLDLQAKLAEANAKLADAEFGKFDRELRDSNNEWLRNWGIILLAFLSVVGVGIWSWLKNRINQSMVEEVEKNINGFKEALQELAILKNQQRALKKEADTIEENFKETIDQLNILEDQQRVLEKEHVVSVLNRMFPFSRDYPLSEEINVLREETLLQVLRDERYHMAHRCKAAEVLAYQKKSPLVVSPTLELLNSFLDSDMDSYSKSFGSTFIKHLGQVPTSEVHQGLTKFLNCLLAGEAEDKALFLMQTIPSLADVGVKLNIGDAVPILKEALSHFKYPEPADFEVLRELAEYFDTFNEPGGIKEILINHMRDESSGMEDAENRCLELLQKYDPAFVEEWRAKETTNNSEA